MVRRIWVILVDIIVRFGGIYVIGLIYSMILISVVWHDTDYWR
jgi:hypothetical protein